MRNPVRVKKWPVCLIAAVAACSGTADNEVAADNAAANAEAAAGAAIANEAGAAAGGNEAGNAAESNTAAAPADAGAGGAAETYRASGSEPFWSLAIGGGRMVYDSANGPDVTVATPPMQPTRAGYRYVTPELTVNVNTFRQCEAPNGQTYHDTVRVVVGGQAVEGCGGEVTGN